MVSGEQRPLPQYGLDSQGQHEQTFPATTLPSFVPMLMTPVSAHPGMSGQHQNHMMASMTPSHVAPSYSPYQPNMTGHYVADQSTYMQQSQYFQSHPDLIGFTFPAATNPQRSAMQEYQSQTPSVQVALPQAQQREQQQPPTPQHQQQHSWILPNVSPTYTSQHQNTTSPGAGTFPGYHAPQSFPKPSAAPLLSSSPHPLTSTARPAPPPRVYKTRSKRSLPDDTGEMGPAGGPKRVARSSPSQHRSASPNELEMNRWGIYNKANGSWSCAFPGCSSRSTFQRGCDLRKHYKRHNKTLFCRHPDCPQSSQGGFSSKKDRARHEAKHNREFTTCEAFRGISADTLHSEDRLPCPDMLKGVQPARQHGKCLGCNLPRRCTDLERRRTMSGEFTNNESDAAASVLITPRYPFALALTPTAE